MTNIADDFFCIVLDEHTGWPRAAPKVASVGLASGLLAELVVAGYAVIDENGIHARNVQPPDEPLARQVHEILLGRPQHRDIGIWLSYLAQDAFDDIGERLTAQGVVAPVRKRRLTGSRTVYMPQDLNAFAWPGVRIAGDLTRADAITLADLTCVGIAAATGSVNFLLWDEDLHVSARAAVPSALARLPQPVITLLARTETAVADAVLTSRN